MQYEKIFQQLRDETGNNDIDEMVKTFVKYEEDNYSLYNYINALSDELETLEKKKKELEKDIAKYEIPKDIKDEPRIFKIK